MCVWPKHSASPVEVPRRWLLTSLMVLAFAWQFPSSTESSKQRGHHLYCGLYYLWLSLEEQTVQCLMAEDLCHITDGTVAEWCEELQFKSWHYWFWEMKNTLTRDKPSQPDLALCFMTWNSRSELSVKSWSKAFLACPVFWRPVCASGTACHPGGHPVAHKTQAPNEETVTA